MNPDTASTEQSCAKKIRQAVNVNTRSRREEEEEANYKQGRGEASRGGDALTEGLSQKRQTRRRA